MTLEKIVFYIGSGLIVPLLGIGLYFVVISFGRVSRRSNIFAASMIAPIVALGWVFLLFSMGTTIRLLSGLEEGEVIRSNPAPFIGAIYTLLFFVLFFRGINTKSKDR